MRKAYKCLISLAVVLIAGLNFIVPAFAQYPFTAIAIGGIGGASGAGLFGSMAGMTGIDISWSQSGADTLDAMWNVLNPDHVYFNGEKHEATGIDEDVWDYITVDIGDWLSAQSDFIVEFAHENNVQDNDSGTVNTGYSWQGIPYNPNGTNELLGTFTAPDLNGTINLFGYEISYTANITSTYYSPRFTAYDVEYQTTKSRNSPFSYPEDMRASELRLYHDSGASFSVTFIFPNGNNVNLSLPSSGYHINYGENVSWTSTNVNTSVFDGWESAKVKIPHNISGLPSNWTVPDFTNAINNLWDQGLQGQIVIEDTDQPVPPPPVPSTPLGEMPFDDWVDLWGQGIYQQLENQSDTLDLIGSNGEDQIEQLQSIDNNLDDLNHTAESIDTNIGIGNGILGGIRSLAQSAVDYLEGIAEHVGELVEEIVEGTVTLIAGILNQIPQAFGIIFGPIKQASTIWHYVVEWIQSIGAPFHFIWSMASGTSYYIILPVYASLAAAVVLAFYKRFGK